MNSFRFDLIGLHTDEKPINYMADGSKIMNGSTFYEVDTGAFYIYYKGEWYLQEVE